MCWRAYTDTVVNKNARIPWQKKHPAGIPWDAQYSWRMGRDSNPRWSCPHSGFQDRRIRPLCHPSETFFYRRSFKPAVLFAFRTYRCCSPLVRARLHFARLADSYARPSHSTAAITHPKLFFLLPAGLSNLRFCSLFAPIGAAHHSFALDFTSLVLLTRMQDRRIRPRLSPIRNFSGTAYSILFFSNCNTKYHHPC